MTDALIVIVIVAACLGIAWFATGRIVKLIERKRKNGRNNSGRN